MLPEGSIAARACRYVGLNDETPLRLAATHLLTVAQIANLKAAIDDSEVVPLGESFSCPADDGSVDSVTFVYPTGLDVRVIYDHNGCRFLHNGVRDAFAAQGVAGELDRMLATPH